MHFAHTQKTFTSENNHLALLKSKRFLLVKLRV